MHINEHVFDWTTRNYYCVKHDYKVNINNIVELLTEEQLGIAGQVFQVLPSHSR